MIYHFTCSRLPQIYSVYSVIRKTVWKIADPYHIIIFVKSGHCQIELNNSIVSLEAGDLFYIPANVLYTRRPLNDEFCEMLYIHFDITGNSRGYEDTDSFTKMFLKQSIKNFFTEKEFSFFLPPKISFKDNADKIIRQISQIKKLYNENGVFEVQAATFSLCTLLSQISDKFISYSLARQADNDKADYPEPLKKALAHIKSHYTEPISLEDLCRVSFVSKQMIIRHFNKYLGKSPAAYTIEYRINRIKPILTRYPNMSIKEICSEFGFEDQCYFSRIFKKYTGESPTEYRKRIFNFNQKKHLEET